MRMHSLRLKVRLRDVERVLAVVGGSYETQGEDALVGLRMLAASDMEALDKLHALLDPLGIPLREIRVASS